MSADITVALVGIGGYGNFYLRELLPAHIEQRLQFVAGIDPSPRNCQHLQEIEAANIPIYQDLEQFYAGSTADLVIITAPIHWHAPLTCMALEHGSHVLCEKPVAATVQDAYAMAEAAKAARRIVAIGYQWSFSNAIQALKRDILAGEFGRPLRLKTKVFWARPQIYFTRSNWAGRLKTANGAWVLDSIANNAAAHYLHNMFYVLGDSCETSVWPVDVQAELYRANAIENYDAAAIRCRTGDGVEILFYAAHCIPIHQDPVIYFEFERAVIEYSGNKEHGFTARFFDGRCKHYGGLNATDQDKLWQTIDAVRTGAFVACGIQAAMPHIACINGAQESMPDITPFPADVIRTSEWRHEDVVWVDGLQEQLEACYEHYLLPSEMSEIPWAKPGNVINLRDYRFFPSNN